MSYQVQRLANDNIGKKRSTERVNTDAQKASGHNDPVRPRQAGADDDDNDSIKTTAGFRPPLYST